VLNEKLHVLVFINYGVYEFGNDKVDQEIDGKMKRGRMEDLLGEKGWKERVYKREEWKKQEIVAFCTCQWNE